MNRRKIFWGAVTGILVATGVCLNSTALAQEPSDRGRTTRKLRAPHTTVNPPTDANFRIAPDTVVLESYASDWEEMVRIYDCAVNYVKAQGYTKDDEYWSTRVMLTYVGIELGKMDIECETDATEEAAEAEEE